MDIVLLCKVIQIAGIAVLFLLFVYAKMQKPSEMQKYASMLTLNMMLMLFGSLLEMNATTLESAYYGTVVSYIGEPFLLLSVFLLVSSFYGRRVPKWAFGLLMGVALFISVIVYTNPHHHLYYSYVGFDANAKFTPLVLKRGPLYYLNIASMIFYTSGVIVMIVKGYRKAMSPLKRRLSVYSLLMVISALAGFTIYWTDIAEGYDTSMLGLTIGSIFLMILFFRCRIFDVVDMAKDYALDVSSEGLLVYDDTGDPVYRNAAAEKVLDAEIPGDYVRNVSDGSSVYKPEAGDKVYSIHANSIRHGSDYLGKSVEIHDITEIHNSRQRLEAAVEAATDKLENIQRTILGSFASLVEARSLETGDHIKRVSRYTEIIAESLKNNPKYTGMLSDEYITMLVQSAPLHDVGKISISDLILLKPGKLTPEEFEKMKEHSRMGAEVIRTTMEGLESEDYVEMAAKIALHHHERWDGTGYPGKLKGEEIPLSARIVAVADCYDAMTSKRCYKDAFPDERALNIIMEESGTHFDPDVVEAFINVQNTVRM